MEEKILTAHPNGKQGVRISKDKYERTRKAILSSLEQQDKLTFEQLVESVERKLAGHFDGSIAWYTTTVKLDLEARNEIIRNTKTKPTQYQLAGAL